MVIQGLQEGPRWFEAVQGLVVNNGSPITSCSGTDFNFQVGISATTGSAGWVNFFEKYKTAPGVFLTGITGSSLVYLGSAGVGSFFVVGSTSAPFNWFAVGQR